MQYRVANFYHAWLCNVRGCDCPEHNSMTYVFLESIVNYKLGDTLLKIQQVSNQEEQSHHGHIQTRYFGSPTVYTCHLCHGLSLCHGHANLMHVLSQLPSQLYWRLGGVGQPKRHVVSQSTCTLSMFRGNSHVQLVHPLLSCGNQHVHLCNFINEHCIQERNWAWGLWHLC